MKFCDILSDVKILSTNITSFNFCVGRICSDTCCLSLGDVFVCRRGTKTDGHTLIRKAYELGARTFVVDTVTQELKSDPRFRYICVEDTSLAEVKLLNAAYGYPGCDMRLIAITGTNGKTSCAYMLKAILDKSKSRCGLIGTVKCLASDKDITKKKGKSDFSSMTTPSPAELFELLSEMRSLGCDTVILEASSHALSQRRLDSLKFELGIFTNLSEDHLDYHKSLSDYRSAKAHLFELCENALINTDDSDGRYIAQTCPCTLFTYGKNNTADYKAVDASLESTCVSFNMHSKSDLHITCPIPGEFSVYNALAAAAGAKILGVDDTVIQQALGSLAQIPGRLERISTPDNTGIFIDYAHTPDALEKVIMTLKKICTGRLITVFGCGGDREREKRPIMGRIASSLSDITVVTSDNCRSESPDKIISEIVAGIKRNSSFKVIYNRKEAIEYALGLAKDNDIVLLAGKGHEDYDIIGKEKHRFSEREIVQEYYKKYI